MTAPERIWAWNFMPSKVLPEIKTTTHLSLKSSVEDRGN